MIVDWYNFCCEVCYEIVTKEGRKKVEWDILKSMNPCLGRGNIAMENLCKRYTYRLPKPSNLVTELETKQCRIQRLSFGPVYKLDLFSSCGNIYVSSSSVPPRQDLVELITICGGHVVTSSRSAYLFVGKPHSKRNEEIKSVETLWNCCKHLYLQNKTADFHLISAAVINTFIFVFLGSATFLPLVLTLVCPVGRADAREQFISSGLHNLAC
ncbi:hypothetical protein ANN_20864 [Periplaneta americana]|uniref:BRCT domain-containing protein n=1 Tax=Periplaneta americana TaxID=6978 RepID=A0ABQ8SE89_PERAM|nr:hypothetical protein ANN_20864 [Periplaneta americana]